MKTRLVNIFLPTLAFLVGHLVMMFPVSVRPGSLIFGRPFEDAFEYVWYLGWYKIALFDKGISPLHNPDIFYPGGWDLRFSAFPPIHPTLFAPLTALIGAVATYNVLIALTNIGTGLGVYAIARQAGANKLAALFAGFALVFYPQREMYLGGHMNFLFGVLWLTWAIFCLIQAIRTPGKRMRWMVLTGFLFALSIGGSWHFVFIGGIALGMVWLLGLGDWRGMLRPTLAFVFVTTILIGPFLYMAYTTRQQIGGDDLFTFNDTNASSVSLERLIAPAIENNLVPDALQARFPVRNFPDDQVGLGYSVVILAVLAVIGVRPKNGRIAPLLLLAVTGVLLMLGLTLHINHEIVRWNGVEWLGRLLPHIYLDDGTIALPMPALLLYEYIPPFRTFHSFGRWGIVAMLGLAPLAALAITRLSGRYWSIALVAIPIILLEFNLQPLPNITSMTNMQRGVDQWLAEQPGQHTTISYPLSYGLKGNNLYYWLNHQQRMINGAGSLLPPAFRENRPLLEQWPSEATIDLLLALEVDYVLVNLYVGNTQFEENMLPQLEENERVGLVGRFPHNDGVMRDVYLFSLQK